MAQVKKQAVREAILGAAFERFRAKGYHGTTLADIARAAGVATSNIYVYFGSKLDLMAALFTPWLEERLARLETELEAIAEPRARLKAILLTLWHAIPLDGDGLPVNYIQGVASVEAREAYSRALLSESEARVVRLLRTALPPHLDPEDVAPLLAHMLFMAFDGFVVHNRVAADRSEAVAEMLCDLMFGPVAAP